MQILLNTLFEFFIRLHFKNKVFVFLKFGILEMNTYNNSNPTK